MRRGGTIRRRAIGLAGLAWLLALCVIVRSAEASDPPPRTLVLALDGVPYRAIERARAAGAFDGWPAPVPLVATFPSMTNVGFTAILEPFGVDPARGYELHHFDRDRNEVRGGAPVGYADRAFAWRDRFDLTPETLGKKIASYAHPRRGAWREIEAAEQALLAAGDDLVLAHVGATDALMHLQGDDAIHELLMRLDERLTTLRARHEAERGRPLRFVLLSDHGNSASKIRRVRGLRRALRRAGLHPTEHLERPGDVVAPTFGLAGYGALHTRAEDAARAARAIAGHTRVDVVAWIDGARTLRIAARGEEAALEWRGEGSGRRIAYRPEAGDPLGLVPVVAELRERRALDDDGFAAERAWLRATADAAYPDAPRRLVDGLTGAFVDNHASVLFSLAPGWAWGWRSGHVGAFLRGGRLEGTHGGLDAVSSLAFLLSDDAALVPDGPVAAEAALSRLVRTEPRQARVGAPPP